MSLNLKGVHVVRTRTTAGIREYHYAWRGGPRLVGALGSQEYVASYYAARRASDTSPSDRLSAVIAAYRDSAEFKKLSPHTARAYRRYLDLIDAKFGNAPLAAVNDVRVRRQFLAWRDSMAATPRAADYAVTTLKRLLAWAVERVYIKENHAAPIGRLHSADRSDSIWTAAELDAFAKVASKELTWAVQLASFTGLRQSDLIRLPWSAFDGRSFTWRTAKRKRDVLIPATEGCRTLMGRIERRGPIILTTERGKRPWTADGLRSSFGKACTTAGVDRTFHDLRRTAATRLLIHGMNDQELAMQLGWSTKDIEALKRKYVSRAAVTDAMLAKLDRGG